MRSVATDEAAESVATPPDDWNIPMSPSPLIDYYMRHSMRTDTHLGERRPVKREKPLRRCLLPGCDRMHRHNGGYCCAEHCREHRSKTK